MFDLPTPRLLEAQAAWLAPARSRLLRRADIARRRHVLDLACGCGAVTEELVRRSGGAVVAFDRNEHVIGTCLSQLGATAGLSSSEMPESVANTAGQASSGTLFHWTDRPQGFRGAAAVRGDAARLPFAAATFDLVFCQFALMWLDAPAVVREIRRVLSPGGALVAIEPDYGGLIEHPPEIAVGRLWLAALERAGADPYVGRKLPALLAAEGFEVRVDLLDRLEPPSPLRFDILEELPLTADERAVLDQARRADAALDDAAKTVHLPMFLATGDCWPPASATRTTRR